MKNLIKRLVDLQECDSQLVKLSTKKVDLPGKIQALEDAFEVFKESVAQNKKKYDELKKSHADCEVQIKKNNETVGKTKERLLEVKNNKEYQAMLKEIEATDAVRGEIESQMIVLIEDMDKLTELVKRDEETIREATQRHEQEKSILARELEEVDSEVAQWRGKREALQQEVPPDLLGRYERIKHRNHGVGVIPVWKGVCGGCHMNIPPQLYNELQRSAELLSCPNCNRIMYFQDPGQNAKQS